ncbi:MAG: YfcE family phosphodiesterase [Phycisphaerae bacterium]
MKIGILSDSHGHLERLGAAVAAFQTAGAEVIVHCGDVGSLECLEAMAAAAVPCYVVTGNIDRPYVEALADTAAAHGLCFHEQMITIPLGGGRTLAAVHGHDEALLKQLVAGGQYAYVCHGHTHKVADTRVGCVRVINPGALHDCHPHTVAVLNTETDDLQVIPVSLKA